MTPRDLASDAPKPRPAQIFQEGDVLSLTYEIRGLLGAGGMGQVYEAHDRALDRTVAIKIVIPGPHNPPVRDEGRALAAFKHPSLPAAFHLGSHRGWEYLVMERIFGVSLADHLAERSAYDVPVEESEAIRILESLAEALSVVHRAGLIHRDIKPANVMLAADARVVLMDLGLGLAEVHASETGYVAGSPPYMSPEALRGTVQRGAAQLVDVYALGVLAYEILSGVLPREVTSLDDDPFDYEVVPVNAIRPDISPELNALVHRMLAISPGERPESADSVLWELRWLKRNAAVREPVRVLIVEDDRAISDVVSFYVRDTLPGAHVERVADGQAALEAMRAKEPDIMVLDVHMPRMNGIELCMYMRGAGIAPHCAIIPVSAGLGDHDRQLLHQLGVERMIEKGPNLRRELKAALQKRVSVPPPPSE